jgi:hypothetical protein
MFFLSKKSTPEGHGFHLVILFYPMGLGLVGAGAGLVVGGSFFQGSMGHPMVVGTFGLGLAFGSSRRFGCLGRMGMVDHV